MGKACCKGRPHYNLDPINIDDKGNGTRFNHQDESGVFIFLYFINVAFSGTVSVLYCSKLFIARKKRIIKMKASYVVNRIVRLISSMLFLFTTCSYFATVTA